MLPRICRIPKDKIEDVIKLGSGPNYELFYVKSRPNGLKNSRFSIIVSKKVEKTSVRRHLVKRRVWGILEKLDKDGLDKGIDSIIFIKKRTRKEDFLTIKEQLFSLFG